MSVWMFFFDRNQWDDLYVKNCTLKTNEEWYASGNANVPLGMLYATIGIICEVSTCVERVLRSFSYFLSACPVPTCLPVSPYMSICRPSY